ncbi:Hypothetical predicted protein [Paramuricea clavata]|uniref:Uncharacterized protein n=1 Tax=Paramuricea clavata TaxID=317549 RepID=A0A6S7J4Z5_PARCT|nr:Hypothetical predicted protein [Paramuricea clavata]
MTNSTYLLQIQRIKTTKGSTNVLWDSAASICLITYSKAKEEKLHGKQVQLSITKGVSAEEVARPTGPFDLLIGYEYAGFHPQLERRNGHLLLLKNQFGKCIGGKHPSIKEIHPTSELTSARANHVNAINVEDIYNIEGLGVACSPCCGGCKCGKCPPSATEKPVVNVESVHLLLLKNQFGKCIGGKHPSIKEIHPTSELTSARANHVNAINVEDIYNIEGLGVACSPCCGGCKCGKCPKGSNDYTLKAERELKLIESKLTFDDEEKKWTAEYQWIRNPQELPDNRWAAMRDANEEELNSEMEQNNEITSDVEERQVDEERPHVGQAHESHESREVEETQRLVKVNGEGSRSSERNEIPRRQAKRVVEPSNTTRKILTHVGEKRKGSPDVQLLGRKRKDTDGRNEQKNVVDKKETAARDVIARQDIETRKNDVRVQNKRRVVRAVGDTNLTAERNIGATSDFLITKVIKRAKNDGGARNDEKAKESSGTRMSAEQRNEGDMTSNITEITRKDVAAHNNSDSKEDAGSVLSGEKSDNSNTTHVHIRNGDVRNSDARKSQEGGGKTLTDTSRNNEDSNEAIRKSLEGKPFIFSVCGK